MDCEFVELWSRGAADPYHLVCVITLMDLHGHVIFSSGMKPPGTAKKTPSTRIVHRTKYSGVTEAAFNTFPDYTKVLPVLYRTLDTTKVLVGCGLDNDLSALGLTIPATHVRDIGSYFPLQSMARRACKARHAAVLPALCRKRRNGEFPDRVGLKTLVEAFTGMKFHEENQPHNAFVDCLVTLALYSRVREMFEDSVERNSEVLCMRTVGEGFPLNVVRSVFLPPDKLLHPVLLNVDKQGNVHDPAHCLPNTSDAKYYFVPKYIRQEPSHDVYTPGIPAFELAYNLATKIIENRAEPNAPPGSEKGPEFGPFARCLDEQGNPRVGRGSMSEDSDNPPLTEEEELAVALVRGTELFGDRSGINHVLALRGSPSAATAHPRTFEELTALTPLPPDVDWATIFYPFT